MELALCLQCENKQNNFLKLKINKKMKKFKLVNYLKNVQELSVQEKENINGGEMVWKIINGKGRWIWI